MLPGGLAPASGGFFVNGGNLEMAKSNKSYRPLFMASSDEQTNARINQYARYGLDLFAGSYKTAADILVHHVVQNNTDKDALVYPIVFLYRQYLELRLKEIIREGKLFEDEGNEFPKIHRLHDLWPSVKEIIEKVYSHEDSNDSSGLDVTEHVIKEFKAIDPESMSFRYPEDTKGNLHLTGLDYVDIKGLAETIEEVFLFLEGISDGICAYQDYKDEADSAFY
jgi:hypothetical protein